MRVNRHIYLFILCILTSVFSFGQTVLPKWDSTFLNKDGSEVRYKVVSNTVFMDVYRNGVKNGPHKAFYKNGKLWYEDTRIDNKIEGKSIEYTPDGHIAEITEWKNSTTISKLVFYQSNPWNRQKYFFVSKTGFYIQKGDQGIRYDKTTPDSLIQWYNGDYCMWLNGEMKIFLNTEPAKIEIPEKNKSLEYLFSVLSKEDSIRFLQQIPLEEYVNSVLTQYTDSTKRESLKKFLLQKKNGSSYSYAEELLKKSFLRSIERGKEIGIVWSDAKFQSSKINTTQKQFEKEYEGEVHFTYKEKSYIVRVECIKYQDDFFVGDVRIPYLNTDAEKK